MVKNFAKTTVGICAIEKGLDLAIFFNPSILAHSEKDDTVDGELDSKVKFRNCELWIFHGNVFRQSLTP